MKRFILLIISLITLTSCTSNTSSDKESGLNLIGDTNQSMEEQKRMMRMEEQGTVIDDRWNNLNSLGWYVYDLDSVSYTTNYPDYIGLTRISLNPEFNSIGLRYGTPDKTDKGEWSPITDDPILDDSYVIDEFGTKSTYSYFNNASGAAKSFDLSSKKYTVVLKFENREDITIEITLP